MTIQRNDTVEIRSREARFETSAGWLESRHSFSFANHYDPTNTHHGLLLVHNDDVVKPNTGFRTHPHQDMEIVTWVLDGELEHKDSEGNHGIIYPGLAQRMTWASPEPRTARKPEAVKPKEAPRAATTSEEPTTMALAFRKAAEKARQKQAQRGE